MFSSMVDGFQSPVFLTSAKQHVGSFISSYIFFAPRTDDREQRMHLFFSFFFFCTLRRPLFLTSEAYAHIFFFPLLFFVPFSFDVGISVCVYMFGGQGYENKSLPLSQVMCLFSRTHLLVYLVVAFLPSYRLALVGHFSPSNPVHHILVLESVK